MTVIKNKKNFSKLSPKDKVNERLYTKKSKRVIDISKGLVKGATPNPSKFDSKADAGGWGIGYGVTKIIEKINN